jgi:hypothetical protein
MVHSSGWMELLGIIAGYESFTKLFSSRIGSAKTLSRLLWDENTGPLAGTYAFPSPRQYLLNAI